MHFYFGLVMAAFGITFLGMIPFIGLLFKIKFTRRGEETEKRKGATEAFYKIRGMQSAKPPLATGGGIWLTVAVAVMFAVVFGVVGPSRGFTGGYNLMGELTVIFATFAGFGILGFYDDLIKIFGYKKTGFFGLRMRHKLILQTAIAFAIAMGLFMWLGIDIVNLPGIATIHLGWGYAILAAFLIVGFANAFDITDGLDGLSCGLLMICLMAFWVIAAQNLDHVLMVFISLWIGSLIAYLYFNVYPARIMLGNMGGLAFGATLAVIGLLSGKMVAMMIISGVFLAEGASSLLQLYSKKYMKHRIFPIAPIHHWLQLIGWEEPKIVLRGWLVGLVLAIFGVWLAVL
jgi:phospho-N-acetylmuramoyl-pentapeptide-transferase